jgi:hypothetical protein
MLLIRQRATERLRSEVAHERASVEAGEAEIRGVNNPEKAATAEAELARLRGDREALERLRGEVVSLKKSVAETRPLPARKSKVLDGAKPDIASELIPAEAWRNAGYATPAAAVETALWAAAGGDTDLLAKSFVLDDGPRKKAAELLASLPADVRRRYAGPEELVAFMAAKDVPLEGARILTSDDRATETRKVALQLRNAAGSVRQLQIELRPGPDGWRLVVPEAAVVRYAEQVRGKAR